MQTRGYIDADRIRTKNNVPPPHPPMAGDIKMLLYENGQSTNDFNDYSVSTYPTFFFYLASSDSFLDA